ncbi:MAG TPA: hypothetical protein VGD37_36325 [Kofleriaceae bacterium]|jgi:hypothetical protein
MRHVTLTLLLALAGLGIGRGSAFATPFEPATVPDSVQAVGHLDVDLLRKTQLFTAAGGQAAIDAALDQAPPQMRSMARTLARTIRGVTFWRGSDHGAIYVETRDSRALGQLLAKLPGKPAQPVDGYPTYALGDGNGDDPHYAAVFADTLVLADSEDSLAQSLRVLGGKAATLAGSNKLPVSSRQGVFVFVTVGDDLLGAISKVAHAKVLQLGLRSLAVDVGEASGMLTANARGEMRSADALQKAKSILDGLRALASLSDEPAARTLLDGVTVTTNGLAIEIVCRIPVAEVTKMIQHHHHPK